MAAVAAVAAGILGWQTPLRGCLKCLFPALWTGLPALTRRGSTFAGRVGASLLTAIGFPELITHTSDDYLALALKLATNPRKHAALREQLAANRLTQLLYDTTLFARHIEAAYLEMWQRHQAGLSPAHIVVPSLHPGSLA